jgi:hypothetical protein
MTKSINNKESNMSSEALKELEEARKQVLESQTVCGWCELECEDTEVLIDHINKNHH